MTRWQRKTYKRKKGKKQWEKRKAKREKDGWVKKGGRSKGPGIFFFWWKFTCQAGRLPAAYSRKIYLTSASQGDKRVDWQRAESHFWSCVLTSDSSSCLFSLNRSTLPIQTKVTDQSDAPLGWCTTPQAKTEHTHIHTHRRSKRAPRHGIICKHAHTHACTHIHIHALVLAMWSNRLLVSNKGACWNHVDLNNRLLKEVGPRTQEECWCLIDVWPVCLSCQEGPGLTLCIRILLSEAATYVWGGLKICNQGNWISSLHCICIESEAHAQIIITKIPIN